MSTLGDIMSSTSGRDHEYIRGFHEYIGGYHDVCRGYQEYIGGCSVHQGFQYKLEGFCPPHAS